MEQNTRHNLGRARDAGLFAGLAIIVVLVGLMVFSGNGSTDSVDTSATTTLIPTTTTTASPSATAAPTTSVAESPSEFFVDRDHPNASDDNPGSRQEPWRTIVHAGRTLTAGQTAWVKPGVYDDGLVEVINSGEIGEPIVIAAERGSEHDAIIRGGGIFGRGVSYVEVRGLKFESSPLRAISFEGPANPADPPATGIVIADNHIRDTFSSAIGIWGVPWESDPGNYRNIGYVIIENNLIELATKGGHNENITVANGAFEVDVRYNTIREGDRSHDGGDEGIDFKEGVVDSRIYGNTITDLADKAIYIDGGRGPQDPTVARIAIFDNHIYDTDGGGIYVVTEGQGDVADVRIYRNLVDNAAANAIMVFDHPDGKAAGGTIQNVEIWNNTTVNSGDGADFLGGIEINHATATGLAVRNNISWDNNAFDLALTRSNGDVKLTHNLCRELICNERDDPRFADADADDYRLSFDSPAIDAGTWGGPGDRLLNGQWRINGDSPDLGAIETATN